MERSRRVERRRCASRQLRPAPDRSRTRGRLSVVRGRSPSARGQSELIGTVLILGMSLLVISTVVAVGGTLVTDRQADADLRSAETAFTNFASKAVLVSSGESDGRTVTLPSDSRAETSVDPDQGRLIIELRDEAGTTVEDTLVEKPLGGVTYRRGGDAVVYEGGGVWRQEGDHTRMVSPPPVHYRGTTFTMPVPTIDAGDARGGQARISSAGPRERVYPDPSNESRQNPLSAATVDVTVESDYYEAWGRFFESRTGGSVSYDHGNDSVTLRLATDDPDRQLRDAVSGTSTGTFEIRALRSPTATTPRRVPMRIRATSRGASRPRATSGSEAAPRCLAMSTPAAPSTSGVAPQYSATRPTPTRLNSPATPR